LKSEATESLCRVSLPAMLVKIGPQTCGSINEKAR
jgi:hypothetical protein